MDARAFVDLLCEVKQRWRERRSAIHAEQLYYVSTATLGHELMEAVGRGDHEAWMARAFAAIERGLSEGDEATKNLVVVGMFEAMQGDAYRMEPPDVVDRWLGPSAKAAWADLIEGWTGEGIRSIEHWRRVIRNGPLSRIVWSEGTLGLDARFEASGTRWSVSGEHWDGARRHPLALGPEQARELERLFHPLVARRFLAADEGAGKVTARLRIEGLQGTVDIDVGSALADGEACSDGQRRFVLALETFRSLVDALRQTPSSRLAPRRRSDK